MTTQRILIRVCLDAAGNFAAWGRGSDGDPADSAAYCDARLDQWSIQEPRRYFWVECDAELPTPEKREVIQGKVTT